ncbi:zinc finger, RING-CH-type, zinc finger, RING/FYVE/PHD-type containing protein [Tanacetum coccineum]|uniref:Zinc finger, RING-CH-type, zinc finger, RING/FYVE/PHD-type containing protein n=1 Tax=Tanacetum coccineum TaxID=301880 RepID=A0ABQ5GGS8_9ASTR
MQIKFTEFVGRHIGEKEETIILLTKEGAHSGLDLLDGLVDLFFATLTSCDARGALQLSDVGRQYLEAEYDDYNATNANGAAFFRSVVLILIAFRLLRHASSMPDSNGDGDEDAFTFFTISGSSTLANIPAL